MTDGLLPVTAPPATPPRLSLVAASLAAETLLGEGDEKSRLDRGFTFAPESCGIGVDRYDPCVPTEAALPDATNPAIVSATSFTVRAFDRCTTLTGDRDREAKARRLLLACESKQIAQELWTGSLSTASGWENRYFASPDADEVTSGAADPFTALACLERGLQLCSCGGRGMIHASAELVSLWSERGVLRREGNTILTIHDTIVVTDAGYDGSGPDGSPAADGSVWAYATGLVYTHRGPIQVISDPMETVDRATNTQVVWAQRQAAATWGDGCCLLAAEIDIDICTIGGS